MEETYKSRIKNRIEDLPKGSVFTVTDFSDIACQKTISKILERLCYDGLIRKLINGIFMIPNGQDMPDMRLTASAIARKNSWKIVPAGKTALFYLDLISTPPRNYTYISDGTYRQYTFGDTKITFSHACPKLLGNISVQTAMLIQIIKEFGKCTLPESIKNRISSAYKTKEKMRILKEIRYAPQWINDSVKSILGSDVSYEVN